MKNMYDTCTLFKKKTKQKKNWLTGAMDKKYQNAFETSSQIKYNPSFSW